MKTDRKLLDLAALAAGLVYEHPGFAYPTRFKEQVATWHPVTSGCDQFEHVPLVEWNPLVDDGDALRLAVKSGFWIHIGKHYVAIEGMHIEEACGQDSYAATRRAIVRAAAEIGKAMLAAKP